MSFWSSLRLRITKCHCCQHPLAWRIFYYSCSMPGIYLHKSSAILERAALHILYDG
jgi:hypothetical protein